MKRNPNLTDLKEELDLILKKIETISKTKKKMAIKLERTKSETDKLEKIIWIWCPFFIYFLNLTKKYINDHNVSHSFRYMKI